jgi:hypothetical protein
MGSFAMRRTRQLRGSERETYRLLHGPLEQVLVVGRCVVLGARKLVNVVLYATTTGQYASGLRSREILQVRLL